MPWTEPAEAAMSGAAAREAARFWAAVQHPEGRLLQQVPPPPAGAAGALDALLFRGLLLVAYAAAARVVLARGTDLEPVAVLPAPPSSCRHPIAAAAVAFRAPDAALAAAFGSAVVVFAGWDGSRSRMYAPDAIECSLGEERLGLGAVADLSWSADGSRLAVVGEGVRVFERGEEGYTEIFSTAGERGLPSKFAIGKISPDGGLVAAAAEGAQSGWVFQAGPRRHSWESPRLKLAELSFGRSGISSLDWKPRGGGLPALLTCDRDGTQRLWGRSFPVASPMGAFMEEVARSPHVSGASHACSTFLRWGGGGGVADDEADACAAPSHGLVDFPMAPKPSRCHQWIVCVAAGDAKAWRARGLDDRPRAQYARLEPASGAVLDHEESTMSLESFIAGSQDLDELDFRDIPGEVYATRAASPIPLTSRSPQVAGMVKSYAISNGERRVRSPEPPEPPRHAAVFTLSARGSLGTSISRYDTCPTTANKAEFRCASFPGHTSPVRSLSSSSGILVSVGKGGDVIVWKSDALASCMRPLRPLAQLKGPHSAAVALNESVVAAVSAPANELVIYKIENMLVRKHLGPRGSDDGGDQIVNLLSVNLLKDGIPKSSAEYCGQEESAQCLILGIGENGYSVKGWFVEANLIIRECGIKVKGRRFGKVVAAGSSSNLLATGSVDGCIRLYKLVSVAPRREQGGAERLEADLDEVAFLGEKDGSDAEVVALSLDEHHVAAAREDGSIVIWGSERGEERTIELTVAGSGSDWEPRSIALETDLRGEKRLYLVTARSIQVYHYQKPRMWTPQCQIELESSGSKVAEESDAVEACGWKSEVSCLGKNNIIVVSFGDLMNVYDMRSEHRLGDRSKAWHVEGLLLVALLGRGPKVVIKALEELAAVVDKAAGKILQPSYRGQGLAVPPPSLNILIGKEAQAPSGDQRHAQASNINQPSQPGLSDFSPFGYNTNALLGQGRGRRPNVFEQLMRRTQEMNGSVAIIGSESLENIDKLLTLKNRLKTISIDGMTQLEKFCLGCLAEACAGLRSLLGALDHTARIFALFGQLYVTAGQQIPLPDAIVAMAVHSSATDALVQHFLTNTDDPNASGGKISTSLWEKARLLGAGFWLQSSQAVKLLIERIARTSFARTGDPDACALWYIALGRVSALGSLYMTKQNLRMGKFLKRDFSETKNQQAAAKNAYVLVSKHRLYLAAAFFILANDVGGALNLICTRIGDEQLAILLARILDSGKYLPDILDNVSNRARKEGNVHRLAVALWLGGRHADALNVLNNAVLKKDHDSNTKDRKREASQVEAILRVMGADLPESALVAAHSLAMSTRPPVRGTDSCRKTVRQCARNALTDLFSSEHHLGALCILMDELKDTGAERAFHDVTLIVSAGLKSRVASYARASRVGIGSADLVRVMKADLKLLSEAGLGSEEVLKNAAEKATLELAYADEPDAAATMAVAISAQRELANSFHVASSRAISRALSALSTMHRPHVSANDLELLASKIKCAIFIAMTDMPKDLRVKCQDSVAELRRAAVGVSFAIAFLRGDWPYLLKALRSCEGSPSSVLDADMKGISDESSDESDVERRFSLESLRYIASNPAVLSLSPDITQRRAVRRPSMSLVEYDAELSGPLSNDSVNVGPQTSTTVSANSMLEHPLLNSALGSIAVAYLSSHLASVAADVVPQLTRRFSFFSACSQALTNASRVLYEAEMLEHVAADAVADWIPLARFGSDVKEVLNRKKDSSAAFIELWSVLGRLPEYARTLSDAATVAAAETAAAVSAQLTPRQARKRFDTASAEYLFGAYPVRFSSSAISPWSGFGHHAGLYREHGSLFRTLCLSSSDPPAIVVATPRGIQEIVPESYTTVPAGFRSHYGTRRVGYSDKQILTSSEEDLLRVERYDSTDNGAIFSKLDHEIEPPPRYVPLNMKNAGSRSGSVHGAGAVRNAVLRHEVEATSLASHPFKRRFATGGTDGAVRLWEYGDPISLVSLRMPKYGRVSSVSFSAYGNSLLVVYASGHLSLWRSPHIYRQLSPRRGAANATTINGFSNRRAAQGVFLDEGNVVAAVGDPQAPPSIGHSLRVFDTREPNVEFHPSLSVRIHGGAEAHCLTLLEDHVRVVTGGDDGSLSVVDLRNKACVVPRPPAHEDAVTCLALEAPRGRALVSGCRNGDIKLWDARTLRELDHLPSAHEPTRHYWSGSGIAGLVGMHGVQAVALTDRSLISCGGDGVVKIWGPGWSDYEKDLHIF